METALQKLIKNHASSSNPGVAIFIHLERLNEYFTIERENIKNAFIEGGNFSRCCSDKPEDINNAFEEYYNQIFK